MESYILHGILYYKVPCIKLPDGPGSENIGWRLCATRYCACMISGNALRSLRLRVGPHGVAVEVIGHDLVDLFAPEAETFGDFEVEALLRAA